MGPLIKDFPTLGEEGGQAKVKKCGQGRGSGEPNVDIHLEKKI